MRAILATAAIVAAAILTCGALGQQLPKANGPAPCVTTPEAQGMDSGVLSRGIRDLAGDTKWLHSLLAVRNGCMVVEAYWPPFDREQKHYLNSATKAVLSALVGIAVHDGKLREDDLVFSHLRDSLPADIDPRMKRITLRHLLTMSSGISWPQLANGENASDQMGKSPDWVRFILSRPMAAEPGGITNYSNGDSHLVSAILQKAVGETALDFARKRLFGPLGVEDVGWNTDPQGRSIGSAALQMRPIDMAKFGSLYLHGGELEGRRILDSRWVESSLTPHVKMPTAGGPADYGYYWWLYPERNLYEAWGGAGQRIAVLRDVGIVVVMTANLPQDFPRAPFAASVYDVVRQSVKSSRALAPNVAAASELKQVLADLTRGNGSRN